MPEWKTRRATFNRLTGESTRHILRRSTVDGDQRTAYRAFGASSRLFGPRFQEFDVGDSTDHERFMRRCLELAWTARDRSDTPVGSVVVLEGAIAGEAAETLPSGPSITGHAEILACQAALDATGRKDLAGAVLYSTAEPCFMCAYAIRQLRTNLVVYGIETPVIGGITSLHPILTDPALDGWRRAPSVIGGVLREACERLKLR